MSEYEILLEFRGSRAPLVVTSATLFATVENIANVTIASPVDHIDGIPAETQGDSYILQRFSDKWSAFVDVRKADDVLDGDRVTLALREKVDCCIVTPTSCTGCMSLGCSAEYLLHGVLFLVSVTSMYLANSYLPQKCNLSQFRVSVVTVTVIKGAISSTLNFSTH